MDATERRTRSAEMQQWEEGRRSVIAFMNVSGLESFYDSCGDEQYYYRAQIRCAGRTEFYTHDRIAYFRECLDRIAETRAAIRKAIKQRKQIEANRNQRAAA
jgi:hypothetical protein